MEVDSGPEHFFAVHIINDELVFGRDPSTLPRVVDCGRSVPRVLAILRQCFEAVRAQIAPLALLSGAGAR